jgi:hypothetical protein
MSPNERQIEMVVRGLAELAGGRAGRAIELLNSADEIMDQVRTLTTWHWRMALEWGLADAHLVAGDINAARRHADRLLQRASATNERTWRTLAHEASARVALHENDHARAVAQVAAARREMEHGPVPLAEWRVDAVESSLLKRTGDCAGARSLIDRWRSRIDALVDSPTLGLEARISLSNAKPIL